MVIHAPFRAVFSPFSANVKKSQIIGPRLGAAELGPQIESGFFLERILQAVS